jgi:hypothetical protein
MIFEDSRFELGHGLLANLRYPDRLLLQVLLVSTDTLRRGMVILYPSHNGTCYRMCMDQCIAVRLVVYGTEL